MTDDNMDIIVMREALRVVRLAHAHGLQIDLAHKPGQESVVTLRKKSTCVGTTPWQALHALDPRIHISGDNLKFQSPVMHITGNIAESVTVQVEPGISRNLLVQRDM